MSKKSDEATFIRTLIPYDELTAEEEEVYSREWKMLIKMTESKGLTMDDIVGSFAEFSGYNLNNSSACYLGKFSEKTPFISKLQLAMILNCGYKWGGGEATTNKNGFFVFIRPRNENSGSKVKWVEPKTNGEDLVNKPPHYTGKDIECIDAIKASMPTKEAFRAYLKGHILRYIWRYESKENPLQDLQKAEWYLKKLIEEESKD